MIRRRILISTIDFLDADVSVYLIIRTGGRWSYEYYVEWAQDHTMHKTMSANDYTSHIDAQVDGCIHTINRVLEETLL